MRSHLSDDTVESLRSAARKLSGFRRRQFQAEMAEKYCDGSARQTERVFGWGRAAVETGLNERRTGIRCVDGFHQRGRKKSEDLDPQLQADIQELVEPQSQADPKFQTTIAFTRVTSPAVHAALTRKFKGTDRKVPSPRTLIDILNRMGYSVRRVQKTGPEKNSRNGRHLRQRPRCSRTGCG
jgi:hypothetical protein